MEDKMKANMRELRKLTEEELEQFHGWLGQHPAGVECYTMYEAIEEIQREKKVPTSGVYVTTECGETHHVEPSQTVSGIYVDGKRVYSRGAL